MQGRFAERLAWERGRGFSLLAGLYGNIFFTLANSCCTIQIDTLMKDIFETKKRQKKNGKNTITVSIATLSEAWNFIADRLAAFSISAKNKTLCSLLFEEITVVLSEKLPMDASVVVHIRKRFKRVSLRLSACSDTVLLLRKDRMPASSDQEIEDEIRSIVLEKNADKIRTSYSSSKKRLSVTIQVGKAEPRNTEEEIERFYGSHKENPPTPAQQILFLFRLHKWGFLLSFLIRAVKTMPLVLFPIITANIIDIVSSGEIRTQMFKFWANICVALFSLMANILFAWFDCLVFRAIVRKIEVGLRSAMIRKLQLLSISFHTDSQAGAITNKLIGNVENVAGIFLNFVGNLFVIIVYVISATIMTIRDCPTMSLFYLLFIPTTIVLSRRFRRPIKLHNQDYRLDLEKTSAAVTEMLGMIQISRAHGLQKNEHKRMDRYFNHIYGTGKQLDVVNQVFGAVSWVCLQFFQLLCLCFSAYLATKSIITVGMIALFQSYFSTIVTRVSTVINAIPDLSRGMEGCVSIAEVLCADALEHSGKKELLQVSGHIELKDVTFRYKADEKNILSHFSLDIPKKSSIAFVGDSGSGKSTLVNLIIGFIMPQEGCVTVDGNNLADIHLSSYRKHIAIVPQHTILFSGTLLENLTYGMSYVTIEQVRKLITAVGLDELVAKLPGGLNAQISESGANLSGGEKQRISLVRALLREPRVIILDEATSALDAENEKRVTNVIDTILGTCTVVMIAHRLSTIKNVDNIVVLEDGAIAEQGSFDELMEKKGIFYRRWNAQD